MVRHEKRREPVFLSIVTWASNSPSIDSRHRQCVIRWAVTSIVSIAGVGLIAVLTFLRLARQRDRFWRPKGCMSPLRRSECLVFAASPKSCYPNGTCRKERSRVGGFGNGGDEGWGIG